MDELDDIKPRIGQVGKNNPYAVPEGYFENFGGRLQERMGGVDRRVGRKILRPAFIYFSGFFLLLIIGYSVARFILAPQSIKIESDKHFANLIEYSMENIDEQTIIEAIPKPTQDSASSEITSEDVIKYLQDQNIDPNSVNDEL